MSCQIIMFGEAKKGMKFSEVVQKDPAYCRGFLKKWGNSPKTDHRMFCHFLSLWIERKELTLGIEASQAHSPGPEPLGSQACPKAKAKSGGKSSTKPMPIDLELEEEEFWDHLTHETAQIKEDENAKRLDHLEGVLSEVIGQLKVLSQHLAPPQASS